MSRQSSGGRALRSAVVALIVLGGVAAAPAGASASSLSLSGARTVTVGKIVTFTSIGLFDPADHEAGTTATLASYVQRAGTCAATAEAEDARASSRLISEVEVDAPREFEITDEHRFTRPGGWTICSYLTETDAAGDPVDVTVARRNVTARCRAGLRRVAGRCRRR